MKYFLLRFSHLRNRLLFSLTMDLLKKTVLLLFSNSNIFSQFFLQLLFCFADGKFHDWKQMVWSRDLSFNTDYLPRKVKHSSRKKVVISIPQNVKEQSRVWLRARTTHSRSRPRQGLDTVSLCVMTNTCLSGPRQFRPVKSSRPSWAIRPRPWASGIAGTTSATTMDR